ncbi:MAG: glycerol-3-phosphate 1-O-acyltransferase PlsY [Firmicutes bacterium]|nr:glycerol-3-phosphate 1-O-acyltransferase PlsY [Bacillota bacterium]
MMKFILVLAVNYLVGSIPFGLLFGRWWAQIDVRQHGSGNIGMTNVLRAAGYLPAFFTLVCDVGKGVLAVLLAKTVSADPFFWLLAGIAAVMAHNWPLFLKFKGGKGVAAMAGVLLTVRPIVALILAIIWFLVVFIYRYISLASIVVVAIFPFLLLFFRVQWSEFLLALIIAAVTVYKHRSNIKRLRRGTEFKFGQKVKPW